MKLKRTYREPHFLGLVFIAIIVSMAGLIALILAINLMAVIFFVSSFVILLILGLSYLLPHPRRSYERKLNRMVKKDDWKKARANDVFQLEAEHLLPDSAQAKRNPHTFRVLFKRLNEKNIFLVYREVKNSKVGWPMILVRPVVYLETQLSRPLNGWVRLWPRGNAFFREEKKVAGENNAKRQGTLIQAGPNSPGKKFFTQEFLAWYNSQPFKPGIHLEGGKCTVVFEGQPSPEEIEGLQKALEKASGLAAALHTPKTASETVLPPVDQRDVQKQPTLETENAAA